MAQLKGEIAEVIFDNPETGYRVYSVDTEQGDVTIRGELPALCIGEIIDAEGEWQNHAMYGEQFKVKDIRVSLPNDVQAMRAFLCSGLFPGLGPATALKIVKKFGKDTFDILEYDPMRLAEINGISPTKAKFFSDEFVKHRASSEAISFFAKYGVSTMLALRAYKAYGKNTVDNVLVNPYRLSDEIDGFKFSTSDTIARGLDYDSYEFPRTISCIIYCLRSIYMTGHVCLPAEELFANVQSQIDCTRDIFDEALDNLEARATIVIVDFDNMKMVYLRYMHDAERGIERLLNKLNNQSVRSNLKNVEKNLKTFEYNNDIKLDETQKNAVINAVTGGVSVITGGPGTGKTTIIKAVISVMKAEGKECLLAAPTGRAAKRMKEACDHDAMTLHRLLEVDYTISEDEESRNDANVKFKRNPSNPLKCDCLIVDEVSMVDTIMMFHTLNALRGGTQLVLVGDRDQLPSVGPGKVLRDIIASNLFCVTTLTDIYRQNPNSLISYNAHLVNLGETPEVNLMEGDFFRMSVKSREECLRLVSDLVSTRLPNKYGLNPFSDIQVITPNRKGMCGCMELNKVIQNRINPADYTKKTIAFGETEFREGDRVMQIKNNYDLVWEDYEDVSYTGAGVFNGEMGVIMKIDAKQGQTYVLFDDNRYVCYDRLHLAELELCYSITVHKSQGSEFDYCIIPIYDVSPMLKTRNLIYTAITRAKKMVIIVGTEEDLCRMIENNTEDKRWTLLFAAESEGKS